MENIPLASKCTGEESIIFPKKWGVFYSYGKTLCAKNNQKSDRKKGNHV
jgi:hypothetical protein